MADLQQELYEKRQKIYPREVHGTFAFLRWSGIAGLLGLYFLIPWIPWDGHQSVLFDLPARKFYVFSLIFWPQDFIFLTALLVILGLALFLFTALAGRLWCGYSCPQTVWTEVFLWVERRIEGTRSQQMKLDKAPMSARKAGLKIVKHLIWVSISFWTAITFVGYFTPVRELVIGLPDFDLNPWAVFWILFFTGMTYMNAGWIREQVCLYMCPYARFQSAMFDKDTLVISYDPERGEPRGSRRRQEDPRKLGLGDCIDCEMCVQVCPTGIDIRKGLQYECIGCAACIDACDDIMAKMQYPKGLIRYTTENSLNQVRTKVFRPRVIIYSLVLGALIAATFYTIATRTLLDVDVIRDRNVLFRQVDQEHVDNVYTLRILNKDNQEHGYTIEVAGLKDANLLGNGSVLSVPSGAVVDVPVTVRARVAGASGSQEMEFIIQATDEPDVEIREKARFILP